MAGNSVSRRKATKKDVCTSSPKKVNKLLSLTQQIANPFVREESNKKRLCTTSPKKVNKWLSLTQKIAYPSYTTMVTLLLLSHIVFASAICRHRKWIIRKLYLYIFSVLRSKEQLAFIFVLVTCLPLILRQILSTSNGIFRCCTWW